MLARIFTALDHEEHKVVELSVGVVGVVRMCR